MKKSLLYLAILSVLVTIPANSAVTVEEMTDAEYLINSGYSQLTTEDIFMQNIFIGYTLGTTRKYHKYIDCKSICEKYNNQKSFRGLSLRLVA